MKKVHRLAGIALFLAAIAVVQTQAQANPNGDSPNPLAEVTRAIDKANAQWSEGWAKRDAAMVAAIFAEDGVQLSLSGKVIKGRQEILERQKAAMEGVDPGVKVTVTTTKVWLDGDTAFESGKYRYEYTEKGKPGKEEGNYVTMWKKQSNGSWKLVMDMAVPKD